LTDLPSIRVGREGGIRQEEGRRKDITVLHREFHITLCPY